MRNNMSSEQHTPKVRVIILLVIFLVAAAAFAGRLLSLQIAESEEYLEKAVPKNEKTILVQTSRGELVDRNGEKLVINRGTQNICLNRSLLPYGKENETILVLLRFFDKKSVLLEDTMPMQTVSPYNYIEPEDSASKRKLNVFLRNTSFEKEELSGTGLYEKTYSRYKIRQTLENIATEEEMRRVAGIRYMLEASDFSVAIPYVLVNDADISVISALSEKLHELPGVEISVENSRYYPQGSLAAHILGRTGPIYAEEVEKYKELGYALDELVGKDGAEYAFEKYLHSEDGYKIVEYSADGKDILSEKMSQTKPPVFGKTVTLTIDAGMQKAAETSLKNVIDGINIKNIRNGNPERCSGAVVVTNCNTGEVYVSASYPTYDQNEYKSTVSDMLTNKNRPLLNRATYGIYPPGSTFKIATAAAALSEGIVDETTLIYDSGIYREYEDYQPHCWYFDRYGVAHGWQNVVDAIQNSCNLYFFEVGRLLGTETLNSYATKFGLGSKTGIETGEAVGILAGPEYRTSVGLPWNPGDAIQSAIGQSDNLFTPLQLASFFSTVVNGGTRYETHLLKSVNDFKTGAALFEQEPVVIDTVSISPANLNLLKRGMKSVVEDGTAASVFTGYKHSVGGKTGTAQKGSGSDNAIFAGFAPYDDPEIVVSVIIEAGDSSTTAATVAKSVFDYYFENTESFSE